MNYKVDIKGITIKWDENTIEYIPWTSLTKYQIIDLWIKLYDKIRNKTKDYRIICYNE